MPSTAPPVIADTRSRQRADRAGRDRIDADAVTPEVDRQIAHRRLKRGLRQPHDVVVRHRALAAIERQRDHRAAVRHQFRGALGGFGEGEAGDHHRAREVLARGVGVTAFQLILVGEADRVDEKIERAPAFLDFAEHRIDRSDIFHVAGHHEG